MKYALDTNTIIHMLKNTSAVLERFNAAVEQGAEIVIPPIVHYEMRRGFLCASAPKKETAYMTLIKKFSVGEMTDEVLECGAGIYADLYKSGFTVDGADLLTAAYCVTGGYTVVTNNVKHFKVIKNLSIEDWTASRD